MPSPVVFPNLYRALNAGQIELAKAAIEPQIRERLWQAWLCGEITLPEEAAGAAVTVAIEKDGVRKVVSTEPVQELADRLKVMCQTQPLAEIPESRQSVQAMATPPAPSSLSTAIMAGPVQQPVAAKPVAEPQVELAKAVGEYNHPLKSEPLRVDRARLAVAVEQYKQTHNLRSLNQVSHHLKLPTHNILENALIAKTGTMLTAWGKLLAEKLGDEILAQAVSA